MLDFTVKTLYSFAVNANAFTARQLDVMTSMMSTTSHAQSEQKCHHEKQLVIPIESIHIKSAMFKHFHSSTLEPIHAAKHITNKVADIPKMNCPLKISPMQVSKEFVSSPEYCLSYLSEAWSL